MRTTAILVAPLAGMLACCASSSDNPQAQSKPKSQPSQPAEDSKAAAPSPEAKAGKPDPKATPPGPPEGPVGADELHRLEGQPESALIAELGEPTRKREFTMGECCTEFSIELLNTYPPNSGHEAVPIREYTWDYEGYALTVWLHQPEGRHEDQWQVLETSRYSDDVEF